MKKTTYEGIRLPNGLEIVSVLFVFIVIMFLSLTVFHIPIAMALILTWVEMVLFGLYLGHSYDSMQEGLKKGISMGLDGVLILITVGALIGTWIIGGIVPTLIYYGLSFIHPSIFLFAAMLLCVLTSIGTGTSWGTLGTAGIAMMGVAQSFGIPLPMAAGAVISGAFLGDKISPLSDTTVLTASLSNVSLIKHVKSMLYEAVPTFVITGVLYMLVGFFYVDESVDMSKAQESMVAIKEYFNIQWYMLIPIALVIILLIVGVPSIPAIACGSLLGVIWAILFQGKSVHESFMALFEGYTEESNYTIINKLLNTGGISSMLDIIFIIILALGLGGLMEKTGILQAMTNKLSSWINSTGRLTSATILTAFLGNFFGGSTYVGIITGSKVTEKNYEKMKISKSVLSRNTEAGATVTSPLIPWCDGGVFVSGVLGISTLSYLPFAWLNIIGIIISLIYGFTGWFMWRTDEHKPLSKIPTTTESEVGIVDENQVK